MIEAGVSVPRAVFAFNSTNVEGWGLYAEWMMLPYMPAEGQLISLQFRLLRAARAFLDPELHMGRVTPDEARRVLREDVVMSPAMTESEVERYMFRTPAQATSYFYGYTQLRELRSTVERSMGARFNPLEFHDYILAQGLASAHAAEGSGHETLHARRPTEGRGTFADIRERTEPMIPAPADVAAPPADAEKTPSGLATKVQVPGAGKRHPAANSRVRVHYTGWTTDGKMFDSSVARKEPITFGLNQVIAGWTEGVQLMVEGEDPPPVDSGEARLPGPAGRAKGHARVRRRTDQDRILKARHEHYAQRLRRWRRRSAS